MSNMPVLKHIERCIMLLDKDDPKALAEGVALVARLRADDPTLRELPTNEHKVFLSLVNRIVATCRRSDEFNIHYIAIETTRDIDGKILSQTEISGQKHPDSTTAICEVFSKDTNPEVMPAPEAACYVVTNYVVIEYVVTPEDESVLLKYIPIITA